MQAAAGGVRRRVVCLAFNINNVGEMGHGCESTAYIAAKESTTGRELAEAGQLLGLQVRMRPWCGPQAAPSTVLLVGWPAQPKIKVSKKKACLDAPAQ